MAIFDWRLLRATRPATLRRVSCTGKNIGRNPEDARQQLGAARPSLPRLCDGRNPAPASVAFAVSRLFGLGQVSGECRTGSAHRRGADFERYRAQTPPSVPARRRRTTTACRIRKCCARCSLKQAPHTDPPGDRGRLQCDRRRQLLRNDHRRSFFELAGASSVPTPILDFHASIPSLFGRIRERKVDPHRLTDAEEQVLVKQLANEDLLLPNERAQTLFFGTDVRQERFGERAYWKSLLPFSSTFATL
jgi:hypothetical protein